MATYRLQRPHREDAVAPVLDADQQAVVDHLGGPLLVLAGPGTGKTTALVEAVVDRIDRRGLRPEQVLVLTFSRKAAEELQDRISARLGRTISTALCSTFHAFCYALLRRFQPAAAFRQPLRLLSATEQDVRLRELLAGSCDTGRVRWPTSLAAALGTRGLADEVRAVLARSRELGLEPADLGRSGQLAGNAEWEAVGAFFEEYLDVLDAEGALDYSELIHRAAVLAADDAVRRCLRQQFAAVFVDEYQDTDPGQVRLLQSIAGNGRDVVVVGDPDQSIYGFRGADVRGILDFPRAFPCADGQPAPVIALRTTRRFGDHLLAASRRVAAGLGVPASLDRRSYQSFRTPVSTGCPFGPGRVEAFTFPSPAVEVDSVADLLRRAHLLDGVDWSDMAVLVRSAKHTLPGLRRALEAAGVPVEVAPDETPHAQEPAVKPLLHALRAAAAPAELTPAVAESLLRSPLGGLDATAVRRLRRRLLAADRGDSAGVRLPRPSEQLLRAAVADVSVLARHRDHLSRRAHRLAVLLQRAGAVIAAGGAPEEALWSLWTGTGWPQQLRAATERGGPAARTAHRDLDAVCALFEAAARAEQRRGHSGVLNFVAQLAAQQLPGDQRVDQRRRGPAVRLTTAHRAKGLQWRLVVVVGVQAGVWPDLRQRGSLLQPDRLSRDGLVDPLPGAALLAEERRLFYVAVTRARERLVVTAVASPEPDGDQPSRFLDELGVAIRPVAAGPSRPLSLAGLVGELRRVCVDPHQPLRLRQAAAGRLARLAAERAADGTPLVPHADPAAWWALTETSQCAEPVRAAAQPLHLSGSAVSGLRECPLRWFLSREAAGESSRPAAVGFGSILHLLADDVAAGRTRADAELLAKHLEQVWDRLPYDSSWVAERERVEARAAAERFVAWHRARPERRVVASEVGFRVTVSLPGDKAVLRGAIDRVETNADGEIVVVDFKTGKTLPAGKDLPEHPQLGSYQLAVANGALAGLAPPGAAVAGAELVQLRHDVAGLPKVQHQPAQRPDRNGRTAAERQLSEAAALLRAEAFPARPSASCRSCPFRRLCPASAAWNAGPSATREVPA